MHCNNPPPCGDGYVQYRLASGVLCCRKQRARSGGAAAPAAPARMARSNFSLSDAKKKLRASYSVTVNGKPKAPSFISTLEGVNGRGSAEKIANLRRLLSTCKKVGVPLLRSDGKKFKSFKTLVGQCGVTFSRTPRGVHLSNLVSKLAKRKTNYVPLVDVNESVDLGTRMQPYAPTRPSYSPDESVGWGTRMQGGPSYAQTPPSYTSRGVLRAPPPARDPDYIYTIYNPQRAMFGKKRKGKKTGKVGPLGKSFPVTFTAKGVTFTDSNGKKVNKPLKKMKVKSGYSFTVKRRLGGSVYRVKGPIKKGKTGKATFWRKLK